MASWSRCKQPRRWLRKPLKHETRCCKRLNDLFSGTSEMTPANVCVFLSMWDLLMEFKTSSWSWVIASPVTVGMLPQVYTTHTHTHTRTASSFINLTALTTGIHMSHDNSLLMLCFLLLPQASCIPQPGWWNTSLTTTTASGNKITFAMQNLLRSETDNDRWRNQQPQLQN